MIFFMVNFNKLLASIFLFIIFFTNNSFAEVVNKIEVNGNNRISKETIMVFGDIAIGKNYESSDVNLLIKKLYESDFFSNILKLIDLLFRKFPKISPEIPAPMIAIFFMNNLKQN